MSKRSRATLPPESKLTRYTPARARRLATQVRLLWAEMISIAEEMLRLAEEHDPDSLSQQRMELRTIQIVLHGFSPEHQLWADLRQACADRDDDHSLFRFMNEVNQILGSRLDSLDREIAEIARGGCMGDFGETVDEHFGPAFCSALKALRAVYADWSTVSTLLDFIDYAGPDSPDGLEAEDQTLTTIELRTKRYRSPTAYIPTEKIPTTYRPRPKRRKP